MLNTVIPPQKHCRIVVVVVFLKLGHAANRSSLYAHDIMESDYCCNIRGEPIMPALK